MSKSLAPLPRCTPYLNGTAFLGMLRQNATHPELFGPDYEVRIGHYVFGDDADAVVRRLEQEIATLKAAQTPRLTRADELFIATKLFSRVRHVSKKLANAEGKTLHPELLAEMRADLAECTRLALVLQSEPAEALP